MNRARIVVGCEFVAILRFDQDGSSSGYSYLSASIGLSRDARIAG